MRNPFRKRWLVYVYPRIERNGSITWVGPSRAVVRCTRFPWLTDSLFPVLGPFETREEAEREAENHV